MADNWYADLLRDDAGRMEAQIDALNGVREVYEQMRKVPDCPPKLADYAGEQMDAIDDQIGGLQRQVDDLDDDIHFADPERS